MIPLSKNSASNSSREAAPKQKYPPKLKKEIKLEIAHVLFMDIVAYSKLSVNEQRARIEELNEIVRSSEQFRNAETANRILKIPTGDGMSLVFCKSAEEPTRGQLTKSVLKLCHPDAKNGQIRDYA